MPVSPEKNEENILTIGKIWDAIKPERFDAAAAKTQKLASKAKETTLAIAAYAQETIYSSSLPEKLASARENVQAAAYKTAEAAKHAPKAVDQALTWSRQNRLKLEAEREGGPQNEVQRFFDRGMVGWAAKSTAQAIPSPVGYGPGDVITLASAVIGRDVLTWRKLDVVDRGLYLVATAIPVIPGTFLADPLRGIRVAAEELNYARQTDDKLAMAEHGNILKESIRQTVNIIKNAKNKQV